MTSLRIGLGLGVALLLSAPLKADVSPAEAQGKDDRLVQADGGRSRFGFPRWDNRPGGWRRPGADDKKPDDKKGGRDDRKASPREKRSAADVWQGAEDGKERAQGSAVVGTGLLRTR